MQLGFKARYGQPVYMCTARPSGSQPASAAADRRAFLSSKYCRLSTADAADEPGGLEIAFGDPARAITPQQEFVMYDGEVCLGAAPVAVPGITLHELGRGLPQGYVYSDSMHQQGAVGSQAGRGGQPLRHNAH